MSLVGIMMFAVASSVLVVQIKGIKGGFDTYIAVAACIVIIGFILSKLSVVVNTVEKLQSYIGIDESYMEILLKIVGISYITQFSSDICRECGCGAIGNQIQIFGKISVMLVSMPVVLALIETIQYLLE
jgi:stage III sporulation protein AD